jgi:hypothetical protein
MLVHVALTRRHVKFTEVQLLLYISGGMPATGKPPLAVEDG